MSCLELQEVKVGANRTRFENKWIWDIVEKGQHSEQSRRKVNKMVVEAFEVINLILKLAIVDNNPNLRPDSKSLEDDLSTRAFFIQKLNCV